MGLSIKNDEVERLAREVASLRKVSLTRAIRDALLADIARTPRSRDRAKRLAAIRRIQARIARLPVLDKRPTKAILDDLWS